MWRNILTVACLLLCVLSVPASGCPCKCTGFIVVCNRLGGETLKNVLSSIPRSTTSLDLSDNGLSSLEMRLLQNLTSLETLVLNQNHFVDLPSDISYHLPHLTKLYLRQNHLLVNLTAHSLERAFNLKLLDVKDSSIRELRSDIFLKNTALEHLVLSYNKIKVINQNTFTGLQNLITLDLSNNRIAELKPGTFAPLPNLKKLFMASNSIARIQDGIYTSLKAIKVLTLSDNNIKEISSHAFQYLRNVTNISLANNQIKVYSKTIFKGTYIEGSIDMRGNPLQCGCYVVAFELSAIVRKLNARCMSPVELRGRSLRSLTRRELGCTSCDFNECKNNATCVIKDDYYTCQCYDDKKYEGKFCERMIEEEDSAFLWIVILTVFGLVAVICSGMGWWYYRKQKGLAFCVITKTQCCCCCFITVVFVVLLIFFVLRIISYMYEHS